MPASASTANSELAILSRLIRPDRHNFSAFAVRAILEINFEQGDFERMNDLAEKARRGSLTPRRRPRSTITNLSATCSPCCTPRPAMP